LQNEALAAALLAVRPSMVGRLSLQSNIYFLSMPEISKLPTQRGCRSTILPLDFNMAKACGINSRKSSLNPHFGPLKVSSPAVGTGFSRF
jgi:hypothetical protein